LAVLKSSHDDLDLSVLEVFTCVSLESNMTDAASVRFPPPVAAIVAILIGVLLGRFLPLFPDIPIPSPARYWIGAAIIALAIAVLGAWPIRLFNQTKQDVTPWSSTPEIIVAGPYRFTRNPMYLMMLLICLGVAILLANYWLVLLTPALAVVLYVIAIRHEEAYLADKFGDSYARYQQRVRRWI